MRPFIQKVTLDYDISIPSESQFGPHLFHPGDVRLPQPGCRSEVLSPDAQGAARRGKPPSAKILVAFALWDWLPKRKNVFFGR